MRDNLRRKKIIIKFVLMMMMIKMVSGSVELSKLI